MPAGPKKSEWSVVPPDAGRTDNRIRSPRRKISGVWNNVKQGKSAKWNRNFGIRFGSGGRVLVRSYFVVEERIGCSAE